MVIRKKGSIRFKYDENLGHSLRNKVNEQVNFAVKKEDDMQKDKKTFIYDAWNRICACMDRIDDTVDYLNLLELGKCKSQRAAFDFYEYINCSYVIIECIRVLCHIFKVDKEKYSFCKENKIFKGAGDDEEYFKYIRSLAVVHPVTTNKSQSFIPKNIVVQCSPFVTWQSPLIAPLKKVTYDLDLVAYSSRNGERSNWIHLSVDEFDEYLTAWLNVINDVVKAVDDYNDDYIKKYQAIKLKDKSEFSNAIDYIKYLKNENIIRNNDDRDYIFDKYIRVFQITLTSVENAKKLEKYRNAIEYSLSFFSKSLQNMSYDGFENTGIKYEFPNIETTLFLELDCCSNYDGDLRKHSYELEKSYYLEPDSSYGYYDKIFARNLIIGIKDSLSKYVDITGEESDVELLVLIDLARYLECLNYKTILNRNIPNEIKYREYIIPDSQLKDLYSEIKYDKRPIVFVDLDGSEIEINPFDSKE